MNTREIFRKLVTNQYMPDFDYYGFQFQFNTVSKITPYEYCCCTCAYEHEFVDYISCSGEINEEMCTKIVESITNEQCPHVEHVSAQYISLTRVYGIHIALAAGTVKALTSRQDYHIFAGGSFCGGYPFVVEPFMMPLLKENSSLASKTLPFTRKQFPSQYACPSRHDSNQIVFDGLGILEICIRKQNIQLLNAYLEIRNKTISTESVAAAFHYILEHNLTELLGRLLDGNEWFQINYNLRGTAKCCGLAYLYDRPDVLDTLLNSVDSAGYLDTDIDEGADINIKSKLQLLSSIAHRESCDSILTKHNINISDDTIEPWQQADILINTFPNSRALSNDVIIAIKDDSILANKFRNSVLNKTTQFYADFCSNPWEFIINLGYDVNRPDSGNRMILSRMMKIHRRGTSWRQTVELLLYENPDTSLYPSLINSAIHLDKDKDFMRAHINKYVLNVEMFMDAKRHTWFGHDTDANFALNFIGPLLLECGFPLSEDSGKLLESVSKDLHPTEVEYIRSCLEGPRKLTMICRDVLRRHFKGRKIHAFVREEVLPQELKDFILLVPILKCLLKDY